MTWGGRAAALFPLLYLAGVLSGLAKMLYAPLPLDLLALIAWVYLLPLGLHRVHAWFFPLKDGNWDLSERRYNPWWTSHMLQFPFIAVPWLEALLHFVPGLFSLWLRGWGARVGRGIYWTPKVEIVDRGLLEIGDRVLIGHLTVMCSHMVAEVEGRPTLVVRTIKIGAGAFLGADTQLGPGAVVSAGTTLKVKTRLYWRGEWT